MRNIGDEVFAVNRRFVQPVQGVVMADENDDAVRVLFGTESAYVDAEELHDTELAAWQDIKRRAEEAIERLAGGGE